MIRRKKLTIFTDAKDTTTVLELKRIIEGEFFVNKVHSWRWVLFGFLSVLHLFLCVQEYISQRVFLFEVFLMVSMRILLTSRSYIFVYYFIHIYKHRG